MSEENKSIFDEWNKKSFLRLAIPYLLAADGPVDLRTVVGSANELDTLVSAKCVYDGMKVWVVSEGCDYVCRGNEIDGYSFAPYRIESTPNAEHLQTLCQIQGHPFDGGETVYEEREDGQTVVVEQHYGTVESGFIYPEKITIPAGKTIDDVLAVNKIEVVGTGDAEAQLLKPGFYYYTDEISGEKISVVIERIGKKDVVKGTGIDENANLQYTTATDQSTYKFTLTSIKGGVIKTKYCISEFEVGEPRTLNWKTVEYCAHTNIFEAAGTGNFSYNGNFVIVPYEIGNSEADKWIVVIHGNDSIPANATAIKDKSGNESCREFVFNRTLSQKNKTIQAPFIIKLIGEEAYIVELKASADNFGLVKLSDDIDSNSNADAGVAATPSAVAQVNQKITAAGDIINNLSTAINNLSTAINNEAATREQDVSGLQRNIDRETTTREANDEVLSSALTSLQTAVSALTQSLNNEISDRKSADDTKVDKVNGKGLSTHDFTTELLTKLNQIPLRMIVMWTGSDIPTGWALCDGEVHGRYRTPDLRDKFVVGSGKSYDIGNTGGVSEVKLTVDQMPSHKHYVSGPTDRIGNPNGALDSQQSTSQLSDDEANKRSYWRGNRHLNYGAGMSTNLQCTNTGSGAAHENRPPYYALAFIMYVGS